VACQLPKKDNQIYLLSSSLGDDGKKEYEDFSARVLASLMKKDLKFIGADAFYENFVKEQKPIKMNDFNQLDQEELSKKFTFGSVLLVKRLKGAYHHAAVYMGYNLGVNWVIHVKIDEISQTKVCGHIFQSDTFDNFLHDSEEIVEMKILLQPYSKEELWDRSTSMINEIYKYNVCNLNCEHLAFLLTTGFSFSTQMKKLLSRIFGPVVVTMKDTIEKNKS